jgi:hypothetical protein
VPQCVLSLRACLCYWSGYCLAKTKLLCLYFRETAVELLNDQNTLRLPYKNKPLWSIMLHTNTGNYAQWQLCAWMRSREASTFRFVTLKNTVSINRCNSDFSARQYETVKNWDIWLQRQVTRYKEVSWDRHSVKVAIAASDERLHCRCRLMDEIYVGKHKETKYIRPVFEKLLWTKH